jgi:hypothetical protein
MVPHIAAVAVMHFIERVEDEQKVEREVAHGAWLLVLARHKEKGKG